MRALISGGSGLVGKRLTSLLKDNDFEVFTLSRKKSNSKNVIQWNPESEIENIEDYENFDVVIHLAGENVADSRWSEQKKRRILDSRVKGTKNLVDALLKTKNKPKTFISASAIGIYPESKEEAFSEDSPVGEGFLANICKAWEKASKKISDNNIRLIHLRIGIVLDKNGGALGKMLLPFKLGVGGKIGDGSNYLSWISNEDVSRIILFLIQNEQLSGVFNVTAPNPVNNLEFTKCLAKVLNRPAIFPVPEFVLKFLFGEMAKYTILCSLNVVPKNLISAGFKFKHEDLTSALEFELKK